MTDHDRLVTKKSICFENCTVRNFRFLKICYVNNIKIHRKQNVSTYDNFKFVRKYIQRVQLPQKYCGEWIRRIYLYIHKYAYDIDIVIFIYLLFYYFKLQSTMFKCDLCGSNYQRKNDLSRHLYLRRCSKMTAAKKYSCDACSRTFETISGFRKHRKIKHRTSQPTTPAFPPSPPGTDYKVI